jgi:PhoPQ-activated pathogenicity-related protein
MHQSITHALLLATAAGLAGLFTGQANAGPLADYVAKKDTSYHWVKTREAKLGKTTFVELIMTSQTWRGIEWKHRLLIAKPSTAPADVKQGVLVISGGGWKDAYAQASGPLQLPGEAALFAYIAEQLKAPVVGVMQVPFQPMFDGMVEDALISLTFERFLKTGDPEWPLLLPMVKTAVRAMDTAQQFCHDTWSIDLTGFTVTGASKRGWTTWLTGAVDKRATAIAPMVIDMLNMQPQMQHQLDAWGAYSSKIHDYTDRGLQKSLSSAAGTALRSIVDPYTYRAALVQPKLIMIGTNDHYWPLDALNLYWNDLPGDNHILYVPNNRHGLRDFRRIVGSLKALHEQVAFHKQMPKLSWQFTPGDEHLILQVEPDMKPAKVQAWLAESKTRDFRESTWRARPMTANGAGYRYELPRPKGGYVAIFGEAVYPNDGTQTFLSTNVRILQPAPQAAASASSGGVSR